MPSEEFQPLSQSSSSGELGERAEQIKRSRFVFMLRCLSRGIRPLATATGAGVDHETPCSRHSRFACGLLGPAVAARGSGRPARAARAAPQLPRPRQHGAGRLDEPLCDVAGRCRSDHAAVEQQRASRRRRRSARSRSAGRSSAPATRSRRFRSTCRSTARCGNAGSGPARIVGAPCWLSQRVQFLDDGVADILRADRVRSRGPRCPWCGCRRPERWRSPGRGGPPPSIRPNE